MDGKNDHAEKFSFFSLAVFAHIIVSFLLSCLFFPRYPSQLLKGNNQGLPIRVKFVNNVTPDKISEMEKMIRSKPHREIVSSLYKPAHHALTESGGKSISMLPNKIIAKLPQSMEISPIVKVDKITGAKTEKINTLEAAFPAQNPIPEKE